MQERRVGFSDDERQVERSPNQDASTMDRGASAGLSPAPKSLLGRGGTAPVPLAPSLATLRTATGDMSLNAHPPSRFSSRCSCYSRLARQPG